MPDFTGFQETARDKYMTIRKKSILAIAITYLGLVVVLFIAARFILLENLKEVEEDSTQKYIERAQNALDYVISDLETTTTDWSSWDDTYAFIMDGNEEYIETNLVNATFAGLNVNLMLFIDMDGRIVFEKAYDVQNETEVQVPQRLQTHLSIDSPLVIGNDLDEGTSGILLTSGNYPLIIVSQPALTSEDVGPARGTVIFGRYLESTEIERLAELTSSSLSVYRTDEMDLPSDVKEVYSSLLTENPVQTRPLDSEHIAGYASIRDIYGNPGIILKVDVIRDIYREGQVGIAYLVLVIAIVAVVFAVYSIVFADKAALTRLKQLANKVEDISTRGNITERISFTGNDELSSLAGNINEMLAVLQELYDNEKELRQELEKEIERRTVFTNALVHELKTPLTPVISSSDMLTSELKDETHLSMANNIYKGALRLNSRIDEMLDLAKGEMGRLELSFSPVEPVPLLKNLLDEMTPTASIKKQSLESELPKSLSPVRGDEDRLRQVVTNLLDNALKMTPEGGKITVRAKEDESSLIVEVEDTGPGIPEEDRDKLFQLYYRSEKDRQRFSGLGLGLALCKLLVGLHGGKIWVESSLGEGSTFKFSVPLVTV